MRPEADSVLRDMLDLLILRSGPITGSTLTNLARAWREVKVQLSMKNHDQFVMDLRPQRATGLVQSECEITNEC